MAIKEHQSPNAVSSDLLVYKIQEFHFEDEGGLARACADRSQFGKRHFAPSSSAQRVPSLGSWAENHCHLRTMLMPWAFPSNASQTTISLRNPAEFRPH